MTDFDHHAVSHGVGEYVRDMAHTNSIEGFWSMLKRSIMGIVHKISHKHLDRYVTEFVGRHNTNLRHHRHYGQHGCWNSGEKTSLSGLGVGWFRELGMKGNMTVSLLAQTKMSVLIGLLSFMKKF